MKYFLLLLALLIVAGSTIWYLVQPGRDVSSTFSYTTEEVGFEEVSPDETLGANDRYTLSELEKWQRPPGPLRVGIQAGHWRNDEVPEELGGLRKNGGGAVGGGTNERDVVLKIAEQVAALLKEAGIEADLLPATVPPGYIADAFVSIHADGNIDSSVSGFKIASPRRDYSGRSIYLEESLYKTYEQATGLNRDPSISRRMSGYYAFNWRRYEHAIHPMTPAVIIETGFLTSPQDRKIIVSQPELSIQGIADGIITYLKTGAGSDL
ncbi:MAG: N-acetylmuramoyl-L-alanine amidase [Candidatus Andersenbacteria bacterium]